jgi:hypothetical protein
LFARITSGAAGYFLFSSIRRSISASLIFSFALFAIMCYVNVTFMERRRLSTSTPPGTEMRTKLSDVIQDEDQDQDRDRD